MSCRPNLKGNGQQAEPHAPEHGEPIPRLSAAEADECNASGSFFAALSFACF